MVTLGERIQDQTNETMGIHLVREVTKPVGTDTSTINGRMTHWTCLDPMFRPRDLRQFDHEVECRQILSRQYGKTKL